MAKILITGSADGLGQLAAAKLIDEGHEVYLHSRNKQRSIEARERTPGAAGVFSADLSDIHQTTALVQKLNDMGRFDAIIHNAGVNRVSPKLIFTVNTIAPYLLTALVNAPSRLVYLSSGMHLQGSPDSVHLDLERGCSYPDSKLHVLMLAKAIARFWPDVYANAVNPGWVPTKMGGAGAPDDLQKGAETQAWLSVTNDPAALVSGRYFLHQKETNYLPVADDTEKQDALIQRLQHITGVMLPASA